MENLYRVAEREGIFVEEYDLSYPLGGIYIYQDAKPPAIGLSTHIATIAEKRCIFAEELGHHFTSAGCKIPRQFYCYAERVIISKIELKAIRWAAMFLMPDKELLGAIRDGFCEVWELAEYFRVTEEMVRLRLQLLKG